MVGDQTHTHTLCGLVCFACLSCFVWLIVQSFTQPTAQATLSLPTQATHARSRHPALCATGPARQAGVEHPLLSANKMAAGRPRAAAKVRSTHEQCTHCKNTILAMLHVLPCGAPDTARVRRHVVDMVGVALAMDGDMCTRGSSGLIMCTALHMSLVFSAEHGSWHNGDTA